ncbi:hypothetical protein [Burkholderia sp. 8Y]|uniref:hypothetical protein n=1 Tax=Burkholderia sp. 8Y TaxID=2653133 RepID=UPI001356FE15|nr:hypothetical protein [Burkholderia sp. 8Y]
MVRTLDCKKQAGFVIVLRRMGERTLVVRFASAVVPRSDGYRAATGHSFDYRRRLPQSMKTARVLAMRE